MRKSTRLTDAVEKVFWEWRTKFLEPLMRFVRSDVRDHAASQKNNHGPSYRRYGAFQRRSCPKISIFEIFGVVRFSTFSTASTHDGHRPAFHVAAAKPRTALLHGTLFVVT
jgi:hypothetical protein